MIVCNRWLFSMVVVVFSLNGFSQTFSTSGNWGTGSNWSTGSVPSGATTAVTVSANPTISATYTIGTITDGNSIQFTINSGGNLQVGSSVNSANMTFNNNGTIQISTGGKLEIWGNLVVNNNLQLQNTGTLIIHGSVSMNNGAQIQVSGGGTVTVSGSVTGGNNTQIQVSGSGSTISIGGALSIGNGSSSISTSGGGTISAASCSCGGCSTGSGCSNVLPISLISFMAKSTSSNIKIEWATATELNFDHFNLEKSINGVDFYTLTQVKGHGTTNVRHDYEAVDDFPVIGYNYYRLTSVDFDNYRETFDAIAVKFDGDRKISLSPNPFNGTDLTFHANFDLKDAGTLSIFDNMGLLVYSAPVSENSSTIHFSNPLKSGVYIAKFNSAGFYGVARLMVQ